MWWACRRPTSLVGMARPGPTTPLRSLAEAFDVKVLVSLTDAGPLVDCAPLRRVGFALEDLHGGSTPADPVAERRLVAAAVDEIGTWLASGVGVAVHCAAGIGRTGTVIGATAVASGHDPIDVERWLDRIHRRTGGWPESPWQGATLRSFAT